MGGRVIRPRTIWRSRSSEAPLSMRLCADPVGCACACGCHSVRPTACPSMNSAAVQLGVPRGARRHARRNILSSAARLIVTRAAVQMQPHAPCGTARLGEQAYARVAVVRPAWLERFGTVHCRLWAARQCAHTRALGPDSTARAASDECSDEWSEGSDGSGSPTERELLRVRLPAGIKAVGRPAPRRFGFDRPQCVLPAAVPADSSPRCVGLPRHPQ